MAQLDGADLCYIYPEFNNNNYEININCMVYSELTISKTTKLKEVYRSNEIAEYLEGTKASLWFLDDSRLIMSSIERLKYGEYAILKSKLPLGIYANVMNVRKLKDKLEGLLVELEQISVN